MYLKTLFAFFALFFAILFSCEKNILGISTTNARILYTQGTINSDTLSLYFMDSNGENRQKAATLLPTSSSGHPYVELFDIIDPNTLLLRYFSDTETVFQTTSLDGKNTRSTLLFLSNHIPFVKISPNRDKIALPYWDDVDYRIGIANIDGSNFERLDYTPPDVAPPEWSPDGSKLASYTFLSPGVQSIFIADLTEKTRKEFINPFNETPFISDICWFPDGEKLAVTAFLDQKVIYTLSIITGEWEKMIEKTNDFHLPSRVRFSPNQDRILFQAVPDLNGVHEQIYVADMNLENIQQITSEDDFIFTLQPEWIPTNEGEKIIFTSFQGGNELYSIRPDGSHLTKIIASDRRHSNFQYVILD